MTLTLERARERCAFWQRVLRLQDWNIHVRLARTSEIGPKTLGTCWAGDGKRDAIIRLLHPDDYAGQEFETCDRVDFDWELTLVHELIHVHLHDVTPSNWDEKDLTVRAFERHIDAMANALVQLERGAAVGKPTETIQLPDSATAEQVIREISRRLHATALRAGL